MHPPEPAYPCYLPVLGEFNRMTPHEGPSASLPDDSVLPELTRFRPVCAVGHVHFPRAGRGSAGLCPPLGACAEHVQWWGGQRGSMSSAGEASEGACPVLGRPARGHVHFSRAGVGSAGLCPPLGACAEHVQWWGGQRGSMSIFRGLFATGPARVRDMSSARREQGACPAKWPPAGAGRAQLGEAGKFR
jgi:hypothetical protein